MLVRVLPSAAARAWKLFKRVPVIHFPGEDFFPLVILLKEKSI